MTYLCYSLITICVYIYLGLGLTILLCPKELRRYILFLSPLVGYCYLTLAGWYLYNLDIGGTDVYAKFILVLPTVLLSFLMLKNRRNVLTSCKLLLSDKELLTVTLIGLIGFFIVSLPLIAGTDSLTSAVIGNNDSALYALVSRFLKEFSRSHRTGFFAQYVDLNRLIERTVFGAFLSTSFIASLFSLEVYQLQSMIVNIFFSLGIPLVYIVAKDLFQYNYLSAYGITLLYALNPIVYYTIYNGFQSQIIAMSLSLCIFLLNTQLTFVYQKHSNFYTCLPYLPCAVLFNWGVSLTYPHMLPLLYGPILTHLAWYSFQAKARNLFLHQTIFIIISLLIMSVLSLNETKALISYFFLMGGAEAGWYMPFIFPAQIFSGFIGDLQVVDIAFSFPIIAVILTGFCRVYKSNKKLFILAGSFLLVICGEYIVLSFSNLVNSGRLGGYKSYKLLSFFLPQIIIGCLIFFRNAQINKKFKTQAIGLLLIIVFETCHTFNLTVQVIKSQTFVVSGTAELHEIESNPSISSINIISQDVWQIMWSAYFLARKKLYFLSSSYYPASILNGEWNLLKVKDFKVEDPRLLKVVSRSSALISKSIYAIEKAGIPVASFGEGWNDREKGIIWSGKGSNSSSIVIYSPRKGLVVDVHAAYSPLNPKNKISIYLNGKKILDCHNNQYCDANQLFLSKGSNKLEFVAALPPSSPGYKDPRLLSYAFSSIVISPSKLITDSPKADIPQFSSSTSLTVTGMSSLEEISSSRWRWALGPNTHLDFKLSKSQPLELEMRFDNPILGQDIIVEVNGGTIGKIVDLKKDKQIEWVLKFRGVQGVNQIDFKYKYWNNHGFTFAPNDPRPMAVSFSKLAIKQKQ